jgi:hypothetical protein
VNHSELFIRVVRTCEELPDEVRARADEARGIEETCFDESYIVFLEEQIELAPRGPEWTEILRRRREGLRPFCGVPLVSGHIRVGNSRISVRVDPKRLAVVYWEKLDDFWEAMD